MKNNYGRIKILANFHQTMLVATDIFNNVVALNSTTFDDRTASMLNYSASKKVAVRLIELGIDNVDIVVGGPGKGKEPAIRALMDNGMIINNIKDITPVPHNGCVPCKRLRKSKKDLKPRPTILD